MARLRSVHQTIPADQPPQRSLLRPPSKAHHFPVFWRHGFFLPLAAFPLLHHGVLPGRGGGERFKRDRAWEHVCPTEGRPCTPHACPRTLPARHARSGYSFVFRVPSCRVLPPGLLPDVLLQHLPDSPQGCRLLASQLRSQEPGQEDMSPEVHLTQQQGQGGMRPQSRGEAREPACLGSD